MALHRPAVLLTLVVLASCGPAPEGTEQNPSMLPPDAVGSAEEGVTAFACTTPQQLLANPGFESGNVSWQAGQTTPQPIIASNAAQARTGSWRAQLLGSHMMPGDMLRQQVTIPTTACTATFTFWLKVTSTEPPGSGTFLDTLQVLVTDSSGRTLEPPLRFDSRNAGSGYVMSTIPLLSRINYRGQPIYVLFRTSYAGLTDTQFFVDDTALTITQ
jgi:hypothetical protein